MGYTRLPTQFSCTAHVQTTRPCQHEGIMVNWVYSLTFHCSIHKHDMFAFYVSSAPVQTAGPCEHDGNDDGGRSLEQTVGSGDH